MRFFNKIKSGLTSFFRKFLNLIKHGMPETETTPPAENLPAIPVAPMDCGLPSPEEEGAPASSDIPTDIPSDIPTDISSDTSSETTDESHGVTPADPPAEREVIIDEPVVKAEALQLPPVNVPKQIDEGEDADPLIYSSEGKDWGVIGVFDGMGGAGGRKYTHLERQEVHTGAYWASRYVKEIVEELLRTKPGDMEPEAYLDSTLHPAIREGLARSSRNFGEVSRTMSKMTKILPTTMALCLYQISEGNLKVTAYWAGDSRIYLFDGEKSVFITRDDVNVGDGDPFEPQLDLPMTNCIYHAREFAKDPDFFINKTSYDLPLDSRGPVMLLAATDGCFGYFANPLQFEKAVREAVNPGDINGFSSTLSHAIMDNGQQDDYSFAAVVISAPGLDNVGNLRNPLSDSLFSDYESWLRDSNAALRKKEEEKQALGDSISLARLRKAVDEARIELDVKEEERMGIRKEYDRAAAFCQRMKLPQLRLDDSPVWKALYGEIMALQDKIAQKKAQLSQLEARGRFPAADPEEAVARVGELDREIEDLDERKKTDNLNSWYRAYSRNTVQLFRTAEPVKL